MTITYTFPLDCKIPHLRGVTARGGIIGRQIINGRAVDVVRFAPINGELVSAIIAGKPELEAALAAHHAEDAARQRAQEAHEQTLEGQREKLAREEHDTYSPDHYPGSPAWMKNRKAADALKEFDKAHPEIVAAVNVARAAKRQANYDALSEFVKLGS